MMSFVKYFGAAVVLIGVGAPILLSLHLGGWTLKYTTPNAFTLADMPDLAGKVALVTGGNSGVGFESAKELARKGAHVVITARSAEKGQTALAKIKQAIAPDTTSPKLDAITMDLASLQSVKEGAEAFLALGVPLHILLLNAGVMKSPGQQFVGRPHDYGYEQTKDGFESHIGVNHIGHFYLTQLLTAKLKTSAPSRVVVVSSMAEGGGFPEGIRLSTWRERTEDYEDGRAYGQSKLANILFARELAERMEGTGVTAYSCHPGIVKTGLSRYMQDFSAEEAQTKGSIAQYANKFISALFDAACLSSLDGALTQLKLSVAPITDVENGRYYTPIAQLSSPTHPKAADEELQKRLWEETEKAISPHS